MKKLPKEKCRFNFLGVSKKGPSNGIIAFLEEVTYYIIIVDSLCKRRSSWFGLIQSKKVPFSIES